MQMEFNLDIRKKQLQSLNQYIKSSEDNVKTVFQSLGWTIPKTLQDKDAKMICPLNKNHLISQKTCTQHLETCELKTAGYDPNDQFLSEPPDKSDSSIKLPNAKKIEILSAAKGNRSDFKIAWNGRDLDPLTSDRLTSTFSVDERLALYDYSVKHTKTPPKPQEFTLDISDPKDKNELSDKDRLALERDAKRRRTKYKSVHTSKKSQTEIMREVIDNQMALYTEWIKQKQEHERKEKEKLKKLAKEKMKKQSSNNQNYHYDSQYQYIETIYNQNTLGQNLQWGQPGSYSQLFGSIPTEQGVITDWSHVYQTGIDADYTYTSSGQYTEPTPSMVSTLDHYTNNSQLVDLNNTSTSLYVNQSEESKVRSRLKEKQRYEKETEANNGRNERAKVNKSNALHERRIERKH